MTDQERIAKLRDGTWDHIIMRGPNPTGFCRDETLFVQETADRIEELEAACWQMKENLDRAIGWRDHDKTRAETAEAKLAKAMEALRGWDTAVLAELEGE